MNKAVEQVFALLAQGIIAVLNLIKLAWTWSFGQVVAILQSNWQALPVWKLVLLGLILIAIAVVLSRAAKQIWTAIQAIFKALVALLTAFVAVLPYIVIAGGLAAIGSYVIRNVNL